MASTNIYITTQKSNLNKANSVIKSQKIVISVFKMRQITLDLLLATVVHVITNDNCLFESCTHIQHVILVVLWLLKIDIFVIIY